MEATTPTTPNTPESPPSSSSTYPTMQFMTLDLAKLASHEHRLKMLSELTGHRLPKEHSGKYFLLTDLFSLHAFLKPRNALKRMRGLPIEGKWIKHYSGGRYCTLSAFDRHVLKYIQTEIARKILDYLSMYPSINGTEEEEELEEGGGEGEVDEQERMGIEKDAADDDEMLDELENDVVESPMDMDAKSPRSHRSQRPSLKSHPSESFKPHGRANGSSRPSRSRTSASFSSSASKPYPNQYSASSNGGVKRPYDEYAQPSSALRQAHKVRAIQIQEDMIKEERSCVQFLYNTLRNLHQQIATEYKDETAKQISIITEQLKLAKTRLKEVLEFDI